MKILNYLFRLMTSVALWLTMTTGCSDIATRHEAGTSQDSGIATKAIAIYLAANRADAYHVGGENPILDDSKLEAEPVLSDHDFVSFNTNNQQFEITLDAAKRLIGRLGGEPPDAKGWVDTWFVLKVEGKRVYTGVFSTRMLSRGWLRTVVITPLKPTLPADSKEPVGFGITFHDPSIPIEAKSSLDPRYNAAIDEAVRRLFPALTNHPL